MILVLTEDALTARDVENIVSLHRERDVRYHVLVPADPGQNVLASIVDHLSLGELREALDAALGREPAPDEARREAATSLQESLDALLAAGVEAHGQVVTDAPVPALRTAVRDLDVAEVAVVTFPHAVEDTFHTDWASRARDELQVPVLHLYLGTNQVG
ncbi:hypothetical protein [Cellulomonas bogoriensis]